MAASAASAQAVQRLAGNRAASLMVQRDWERHERGPRCGHQDAGRRPEPVTTGARHTTPVQRTPSDDEKEKKRKKERAEREKQRRVAEKAEREQNADLMKEYKEKEKVRRKRYKQSAKGIAANARYDQSEKGKAARARYDQSEKGKAAHAQYKKTEKGEAANARYDQSEKGKAARARYDQSEKGKAAHAQYKKTEKGEAANARYDQSEKRKAARAERADNKIRKYIANAFEEMMAGESAPVVGGPDPYQAGSAHPQPFDAAAFESAQGAGPSWAPWEQPVGESVPVDECGNPYAYWGDEETQAAAAEADEWFDNNVVPGMELSDDAYRAWGEDLQVSSGPAPVAGGSEPVQGRSFYHQAAAAMVYESYRQARVGQLAWPMMPPAGLRVAVDGESVGSDQAVVMVTLNAPQEEGAGSSRRAAQLLIAPSVDLDDMAVSAAVSRASGVDEATFREAQDLHASILPLYYRSDESMDDS
ncbi:hypothetical protein [Streptomyces sp. NPDC056663]|uniref:hypothetical protein n=1 Tax=Streptomyces sp. NPDC056663 TaxID=3345899 RepID=UPI0036AE619E